MTHIDRQVRIAQRRLWFNRWLAGLGWMMAVAGGAWTVGLVISRLIAAEWPMLQLAQLGAGVALLGSFVWLTITADSRRRAAVAVDDAAGLRERVSSSLYCAKSDDPFSKAVVGDAERTLAGVSARRLIPLRWSGSLNYGMSTVLAAAAIFWLLPAYDLLGKAEAKKSAQQKREAVHAVQASLAKPVTALMEVAEKHPDIKDSADLASLEKMTREERMEVAPDELRREAVKKIDRLSDQLKDKANSDRYASLDAMKKMLSQLGGEPVDPKSPVGQLTKSLQSGDFAGAQEAIKKMQEQLAKRDHTPESAAQAKQMQQQLESLAQKLQQMDDKKTAQKLKEAGISEKDIQRALDALAKKDSKQLQKLAEQMQKQLQQKGMTQQQAQKLMDQLKQQQQAQQQCQKMGQQMGQCANAQKQGNSQQAQQSMQQAQQMLNEMEKMSQELNELETQMSQMESLKDELNNEKKQEDSDCEECKGQGQKNGQQCGNCGGTGKKNGKGDWARGGGIGSGRRETAKSGKVDFVKKKADAKVGKGDVIGQWFVKGKQERGDSKAAYTDAAVAAERDATDAINKEQVPRLYHGPVKAYFDRIGDVSEPAGKGDGKKDSTAPAKPAP